MTTPKFAQWKSGTFPVTAGNPAVPATIDARLLSALASLLSGQNPDATVRGS